MLEENTRLRKEVSILKQAENTPFPEAFDKMKLLVTVDGDQIEDKEVNWGELFRFCCESILVGDEDEFRLRNKLRHWVIKESRNRLEFDPEIFRQIKFLFVGRGLIEIIKVIRNIPVYSAYEREVLAWKLTSYGLRQYAVLMPHD